MGRGIRKGTVYGTPARILAAAALIVVGLAASACLVSGVVLSFDHHAHEDALAMHIEQARELSLGSFFSLVFAVLAVFVAYAIARAADMLLIAGASACVRAYARARDPARPAVPLSWIALFETSPTPARPA